MSSLPTSERGGPPRDLIAVVRHPRFGPVGLAILALVTILALLPYVRSMISRNAVVAAFVYTAHAPVSGLLHEVPFEAGTLIADGSAAAWIEDPRVDDALVSELRARDRGLHERIDGVERQRALLHELEAGYSETLGDYRDALARDVDRRIEALRAEIEASEVVLVEKAGEARRVAALEAGGVVAVAATEVAESALEEVRARHATQQALLERLHNAAAELADDRFMVEGLEGAIQVDSDQRRTRLEALQLDRELAAATAEHATVRSRLEDAEKRFSRIRRAPVQVPDGVTVWRVHALDGQYVEVGEPVFSFVDCRDLKLDLRLDDSVLSLVEPDRRVRFRLFGTRRWNEARVSMVRGSGAVIDDAGLATDVTRTSREGQVLATIEGGAEALEGATSSCGIGRKAFARIDGVGMYQEFLRRLFL